MKDPLLGQLRGMLFFARVVEAGSFSGAARRLGVSRAVVSYQIKRLEGELGVRLLNRSTRRLSLTAAGVDYHRSCQRIATEAEAAHALVLSLREEAVGRVVLACPVHLGELWVLPEISAFRRRYPAIELDLRFSESVANVIEEGVDLAIRAGPLEDSLLRATPLARLSRHLCGAPAYLERHGRPERPEDLDGHEWVLYGRGSRAFELPGESGPVRVQPRGSLRVDSAAARRRLVLDGHGLAVLPSYDAEPGFESGALVELLPDSALPRLELFAVHPEGTLLARAAQLVLDWLREHPPGA